MLKKTLLLTAVLCVYAILVNNSYVYTRSGTPPPARTGAPGESTCTGGGCHVGVANTGSGSIDISLQSGGVYFPGDTYDMTVEVNDNSKQEFGFEMVAIDENGNNAGTFITGGNNKVGVQTFGNRDYIGHRNSSSTNSFSFQWMAPTEDVGMITFYASGNAANGNNSTSGDLIYTNELSILLTNIPTYTPEKLGLNLFPNPAANTNYFNLEYQLTQTELMTISAYDASGRLVKVLFEGAENAGVQQHQFDLTANELTAGVYYISLQSETFVSSVKLIVQ